MVLAHGGSDDGRRFFVSEAADLACCGAAVILPAVRVRQDSGTDEFATDVRDAVLTERAALDVLIAPPCIHPLSQRPTSQHRTDTVIQQPSSARNARASPAQIFAVGIASGHPPRCKAPISVQLRNTLGAEDPFEYFQRGFAFLRWTRPCPARRMARF